MTERTITIEKADIIVILVNHKEFIQLSRVEFQEKIVIDTQGITQ